MSRRPGHTARRSLHPAAWWLWAGCLAGAATRTTNPILLALIAAVAAFVVAARRTDAPWSRSIVFFFRMGVVVIVVRVMVQIVFGNRLPGHVLVSLPRSLCLHGRPVSASEDRSRRSPWSRPPSTVCVSPSS